MGLHDNNFERTPNGDVSWAIVGMVWQQYLRTIKIPEDRIPTAIEHGWTVLARDSDVPVTLGSAQWWRQGKPVRMTRASFYPPSEDGA